MYIHDGPFFWLTLAIGPVTYGKFANLVADFQHLVSLIKATAYSNALATSFQSSTIAVSILPRALHFAASAETSLITLSGSSTSDVRHFGN